MHGPDREAIGGQKGPSGLDLMTLLVLPLSLLRFGLELVAIRRRCCFDFPAALEAVRTFATEGHLYSPVLEDYAPGIGAFKYPPPYGILLIPFARARTIEGALDAYLSFELLLYFAAVGLLAHAFRLEGPSRRRWAVLLVVFALNLGPVFETLVRLQIELPLLFCFAVAAWALRRQREGTAGGALAIAAMLKIYPVVALVPFLMKRHARVARGFLLGVCLLSVSSLAVFGLAEGERFWLGALPRMLMEPPTNLYRSENASIARWLMVQADLAPPLARSLGTVFAAVLLCASLLATRRGQGRHAVTAEEMALFIPVMLLAMPNSWTNYQILLLVPMAAVVGCAADRGLRAAILPIGLALAGLVWLTYHIDTYYYPLAMHLPERLSSFLHDNRWMASFLVWIAMLAVATPGRAGTRPSTSGPAGQGVLDAPGA